MKESMEFGSVYWIHLPEHADKNSEGYIGITNNTAVRWQAHKECRKSCHHLENAIAYYGWDSLIKEVIYTGKYADCSDLEKTLRPTPGIGWNIRAGGGSSGKLSEETKRKLSKANSENTYCLGRKLSQETKDKIGKAQRGKKQSKEHLEKKSKAMYVKVTCKTTGKLFESVQAAARWCGLKTPSAISAVCLGKRHSAGKHPITGEKLVWEHAK